jgi:hypothetical protein
METPKTSLEVNFHGPIAFRFCKDVAWAYLPKCDEHYCNILTDSNDVSPARLEVFELKGPKAGPTKRGQGFKMVELDWNFGAGPEAKKCYCIFKLPSPSLIFGLRAEYVKIDVPGEQGWEGVYARGLRFWYSECDVAPTINPAADLHNPNKFDASSFGHSSLYQMEIRYRDAKHEPASAHHKDAEHCSLRMRKLFPPCDKWKVSFEPPKKSGPQPRIGGPHPVDCGANPLVFSDGILLQNGW